MIGFVIKLFLLINESTLLDKVDQNTISSRTSNEEDVREVSSFSIINELNIGEDSELKRFNIENYQSNCLATDSLPTKLTFNLEGNEPIIFQQSESVFTSNLIESLQVSQPISYKSNNENLQATMTMVCDFNKNIVNGLIIKDDKILEFYNNPEHPLMQEYYKKTKISDVPNINVVVVDNLENVFREEADLLSSEDYLSANEPIAEDDEDLTNFYNDLSLENELSLENDLSLKNDLDNGKRRNLLVSRWTNCYSNDNRKHQLEIGFAIGSALFRNQYRNDLQTTIRSITDIVSKSNLVYGIQLNINLKVTKLYIAGRDGNPSWDNYQSCVRKRVNINSQLSSFRNWAAVNDKSVGLWHLLDDCFAGSGVVGLAWIGTLCNNGNGYHTGISWWSRRHWLTVAHEIGHNFGAQHSFEEGRGRTGGIMDYGNGLLNGEYQFNTRYRKNQVCRTVNNIIRRCGALRPINNIPDRNPTPSPTNSRICRGRGGGSGDSVCVFPFIFRSQRYNSCTIVTDPNNRPWCSTRTDRNGRHVRGNWAYCTPGCPGYRNLKR